MSSLRYLTAAQFLSAFVDNMVLFAAQAIILRDAYPSWYLQMVQGMFLFSYIVLSPWVGRLADRYPKRRILMLGIGVKCIGILILLTGFDPAASYAIIGIGAVIYSPAKYGLLPYLTSTDEELLRANAQVEGFTILAILSGTALGGWLSDYSIGLTIHSCTVLYGISAALCLGIPANPANANIKFSNSLKEFLQDIATVLHVRQGRFPLLGTSGFWMASVVWRLAVFTWLPLAFGIYDNTTIGMMITLSGIGLILGAVLTPRMVPVGKADRVIWFGVLMGGLLAVLPFTPSLGPALAMQILIGCLGGLYVIPLNTMLQRVGEQTVGTGKIVAIQNFAQNVFMFLAVIIFLAASRVGIPVTVSMTANGFALLLVVSRLYVMRSLLKG